MPSGTVSRKLARRACDALLCRGLGALTFASCLILGAASSSSAHFSDVSMTCGVNLTDHTYGLAWGDLDRDGAPDLLVVRHSYWPTLYRNVGNGSFTWNFFPPLFEASDHHGPLMADFDDDGDLDIYITSGADAGTGTVPKKLYRNDGAFEFVDVAVESGLADTLARGRSSSAMDIDGDGALDLFVAKAPRAISPNALYYNDGNGFFSDIAASAGVADAFGSVGAVWGDYDGDRDPDLLIGGEEGGGAYETRLYRNEGNLSFTNVTAEVLPGIGQITSADWGDYDQDGDLDLAVGRGDEALFDAVVWSADSVRFFFNARGNDNGLDGFAFTQPGDSASFDLYTNGFYQPSTIFISEDAYQPGPLSPFKLPSTIYGAPSISIGQNVGIYIWTDGTFGLWQMRCNTPPAVGTTFAGFVKTNAGFDLVSTTEIEPYSHDLRGTRIYRNESGVFVDVTNPAGIADTVNVRQVGWFDYNLDGKLDLFVMNKGDTERMNQPDILYRNLDGTYFQDVTAVEELAGPAAGLGDAFSFEDYDGDGDLDLAEVNGSGPRFFSVHTIHRLYRNDGPTGNALRVDLEGVFSTRDGYGAWVTCVSTTAGRQSRYVAGNSWRGGQSMIDPVFGLGADAVADTLKVVWPSTSVSVLTNVPAGRVVVVEPDPLTDAPPPAGRVSARLGLRPLPNPSSGAMSFTVEGRGVGAARIEIFDTAGRLIDARELGEGESRAVWEGRTRTGRDAAAGVYFARAREGARTALTKFVLLRN